MIRAIGQSLVGRSVLPSDIQTSRPAAYFGLKKTILDYFYWEDASSEASKILNSTHFSKLPQVRHVEVQTSAPKYQVTKLANGVTVLTESATVPSNVQLGILLDVGTRDETPETSGSLLSIKNTYLKTVLNTNETVNYGIHQMSGGRFEMDYDRESTYWRASCLAHDVVDVFSMMVDCAFEPRSVVAANVGIYKNTQTHKLDASTGGNIEFNDNLHRIAYGTKGLGNPLIGNKGNIANLSFYTLQKFQLETLSPHKVIICGGGIEDHQEFVDLVNDKLGLVPLPNAGPKKSSREAATYHGGEVRAPSESGVFHAAFGFEGLDFKNSAPLLLARKILGRTPCINVRK